MAYITLNKDNLFYNLDIISQKAKGKDKVAVVLKDNAYGHGLKEIAYLIKEYGIKKVVVQNQKEAKELEDMFEYILVLAEIPQSASKHIHYTINDIKSIKKFPKFTSVELKIDTGMHRNGIMIDELQDTLKEIKNNDLILKGVFTHHCCSDEDTDMFELQNKRFKDIKTKLKEFGFKDVKFHSANSAALFRDDDFDEDMARIGLAVYGYIESDVIKADLKPVLSLWANRISSRVIQKGEGVGYGRGFIADGEMVVSNYDFGYGLGFLRVCSNNYTTPHGYKLLGKISMDNSSFSCNEDKILIFDDAKKVAECAKTISYEVLTSLKNTILRKVL